jgi:hypothetical protein
MADRYKEGRDYELVPMKDKDGNIVKDGRGGSVKTRRFFTKAKKEAMKAKDKPKSKPKAKAKPKPSAPRSSALESSPRPKQRQTGRGEPNYGEAADTPTITPMGGPRRGRKPASASDEDSFSSRVDSARKETQRLLKETAPIDRGISYEEWEAMTRAERRAAGLPLTKVGWQNQRQTYRSSEPAVSTGSRGRAARRGSTGMAKGGMVKKGTRDYKKSGMFYKSGSPRGYK